jgi:hypothetical protein
MDKETLSNYGWIVICTLVLVVMIALATPFGTFVSGAVQSTTQGLFDVNHNALESTGLINIENKSIEDVIWDSGSFKYKNTKYLLCGGSGSYLIIDDANNVVMYAVDGSVVTTIPADFTECTEKEFAIKNTGTQYDGTYCTINGGKQVCWVDLTSGDKHVVAKREGTCNHKSVEDEGNGIYSGGICWYNFYDDNMNIIDLRNVNSLNQLKQYTLRCQDCFAEIPTRIYDDSDYLYMYNAFIEPQLSNGNNINACPDIAFHNGDGWNAIPFDTSKTNNLYATIDGSPVAEVTVMHGTVLPNTIQHIAFSLSYYDLYNFDIPDTVEITFQGTKSEFEGKLGHPYYNGVLVEHSVMTDIQEDLEWGWGASGTTNTIIIHCTDGDIVRTGTNR